MFEGGKSLPQTFLRQGIDQKGHGHDGDERHDPGFHLEEEALDIDPWILEEAMTFLDRRSLSFVGREQRT